MSSIWGNKWKVRKIYVFDKHEKSKFHKFSHNNSPTQYTVLFSLELFENRLCLDAKQNVYCNLFNAKLATAHN